MAAASSSSFSGTDQQTRHAVPDRFRDSADSRGDNRNSGGHGFQDNIRQTFGGGKEHRDMQSRKNVGDVDALSQKLRFACDAEPLGKKFQSRAEEAIANQNKFDGWKSGGQPRRRPQKSSMILHRVIHAGDEAHAKLAGIIGGAAAILAKASRGRPFGITTMLLSETLKSIRRFAAARELQTTRSHSQNAAICAAHCSGVSRSPNWPWLAMMTGVRAHLAAGISVRLE